MKPIKTSFLFFCIIIFVTNQFSFAQKESDSIKYYKKIALQPQNANDLYKAESYFNINYLNAKQKNDMGLATYCLYFIASIEYKKGEYDTSEETAVKALKILDKMDASDYTKGTKKSLYNLLGLMYTEQKNKSKAIDLYDRALKISKTTSDSANIYNNLSLVYKNFNDVDNAKKEILKAYKIIPRIKDTLTQALIIDNYGVIESKSNNANGLDLMNTALKLREAVNDTSTLYTSYSHLAEHYFRINNKIESKKYALKALKYAEIINTPSYRNDALGLLTKLSEDNFAKAYKELNDSLYNVEKESKNKSELLKYDLSENKRKLLENQLEKERQELRAIIATFAASFIALLSIFLYFFQKSKHKKEKLQQVYNTESRISKKVHDEVANDVFQFMTKLQSDDKTNEHLIDDLEHIYIKTRDISKEHSVLDLEGKFKDILNDLILSYNDSNANIIGKGISEVKWEVISEIKRTTIYKVLQELLINMKKHSKASVAVLAFNQDHKKITISYSDNGIGCKLKKSTGLQNVENRIASVNGTINFESEIDKGFKAKIIV